MVGPRWNGIGLDGAFVRLGRTTPHADMAFDVVEVGRLEHLGLPLAQPDVEKLHRNARITGVADFG